MHKSLLRFSSNWREWLSALAAFFPAIVLGCLIALHAENTPTWDDWERGPLIEKLKTGSLTFKDLYAPHIDHRIFFPRVVILVLNELSGGDLRAEMAFTFVVALLAGIGLYRLAKLSGLKGGALWGVLFVVNLVVFSPMQWDNWMWGVQLAFMLPMTCLIWGLVVALLPWRWWLRLLGCLMLAVVGTHSFGHGFVIWPAVFGLAILRREFYATLKERLAFLGLWLLAGVLIIGCYVKLDFQNVSHATHAYGQAPGEAPPCVLHYENVMANAGKGLEYLLVLSGNLFSRLNLVDPLSMAPIVGAVLLLAFASLALWAMREGWLKRPNWDAALPWLALGGAAFASMAAITLGRLNVLSIARATSVRYISISQYLTVAVILLLALWWQQGRPGWFRQITRRQPVGAVILACLAGFMFTLWNYGAQMMNLCGESKLQAKASLLFINHWRPDHVFRLDATYEFARDQANVLNRYGLLKPALVTDLTLHQFSVTEKERPLSRAHVKNITVAGNHEYHIHGLARLDDRPADGVLLTWEVAGRRPEIFTMAETTAEMVKQVYHCDVELTGRLRSDRKDSCLWSKKFTLADMGFGRLHNNPEVTVKAWMFDVKKRKAMRIRGAWLFSGDGSFTVLESSGDADSTSVLLAQ